MVLSLFFYNLSSAKYLFPWVSFLARFELFGHFYYFITTISGFYTDFCAMFVRLKKKWNVSWLQFTLIFTTFALGGSMCARLGSGLLHLLLDDKNWLYWLLYVPLITLLWPVCVLLISIPLGQFRFFRNYLSRMWKKISGKSLVTRIAIFASGKGSNTEAIIRYFKGHRFIQIGLIVSNKADAGVLLIAAQHHIPTLIIEKEAFFRGNAYVEELKAENIDFIVLAGFLWKIPPRLIAAYPRRIINIHPALLPKYGGKGMYGQHVHRSVLAAGEQESGITIHYVDELYDHGETIFQARCEVKPDDTPETLAARIHQLEHTHYPQQIEKLLTQ